MTIHFNTAGYRSPDKRGNVPKLLTQIGNVSLEWLQ